MEDTTTTDGGEAQEPEDRREPGRWRPPVTERGLAGSAGDDVSGGISTSGVGIPPREVADNRDALDEVVEGGARLGWGGTSNPSPETDEARERVLGRSAVGDDGEDSPERKPS